MKLYTNDDLERFAEVFQDRFYVAYLKTLQEIGQHVKKVGNVAPKQVHQLQRIVATGGDPERIRKILQKEAQVSEKELSAIFEDVARNGYDFAEQFYKAKGVPRVPLEENVTLRNVIAGAWQAGKGQLDNLSNTTTVGVVGKFGNFVSIPDYYRQIIDSAALQVSAGVLDYNGAIRGALKELLRSGVRVRYESGYTRELYSAVRMNVLEATNQVLIQVQQACGAEYGADGVEISVHALCAPDHLPIQGRQFTLAEYEALNSSLERPIGTLNCRHFSFPIVMGASFPTYTREQLEHINDLSTEKVSFRGREFTRYEASQAQRRYEERLRKQNAAKALFSASGDHDAEQVAARKARLLSKEYRDFCSTVNLTPRPLRALMPKT